MALGLFGTRKTNKGTVENVIEMLDQYYKRRNLDISGHEVNSCEGYGWWLQEGSAMVYIFVQEDPRGGAPLLKINSPILHFPDKNKEDFFAKLLELNRDLSCCSFATYEGIVLITSQRPIQGLDPEELNTLVWNVSHAADVFDDLLAKEFNARHFRED